MRSMSTPERLLAQGERGRFLAGHESLEAEESQEEYSASRVPASRDREEGVCPGVYTDEVYQMVKTSQVVSIFCR